MKRPHSRSLPPFVKRSFVIFMAIIAFGSLLSIGVPLLLRPGGSVPTWLYVVAVALPGAGMGLAGAWFGLAAQRHVKQAVAKQYRVCWHCNYHLRGLGDNGTCPECGKKFVLEELRELWKGAGGEK